MGVAGDRPLQRSSHSVARMQQPKTCSLRWQCERCATALRPSFCPLYDAAHQADSTVHPTLDSLETLAHASTLVKPVAQAQFRETAGVR